LTTLDIWWTRDYSRCLQRSCSTKWYIDGYTSDKVDDDITYFHIIRNPSDMIASGYLYHKACSEFWTRVSLHKNKARGPNSMHGMIYCKELQNRSLQDGLNLEIERSMHADDGVGLMLENIKLFRNKSNVYNLCINEAVQKISKILYKNISVKRLKSHVTNSHDNQNIHKYLSTKKFPVMCGLPPKNATVFNSPL
jgi:hypothetical protein